MARNPLISLKGIPGSIWASALSIAAFVLGIGFWIADSLVAGLGLAFVWVWYTSATTLLINAMILTWWYQKWLDRRGGSGKDQS